MTIWELIDKPTRAAIIAAFPGFHPPFVADPEGRDISFTPVIRIEDIEQTMRQIPKGPGR